MRLPLNLGPLLPGFKPRRLLSGQQARNVLQPLVTNAKGLEVPHGVEDIVAVEAGLADRARHDGRSVGRLQRARILLVPAIDDIGDRDGRPSIFQPHREQAFGVNAGVELALAQIGENLVAQVGGNTEGEADAGTAAVETKDETRLLMRAAVIEGAHAKGSSITEKPRPPGLDMRKSRSPHQRAIAKDPKIAHIAQQNLSDGIRRRVERVSESDCMTSSEAGASNENKPGGPRYSRRILWLGVFVVLLCAGYTAGWFYLARQLERQTAIAIADLNRSGVTAECANLQARGYPFRIGLFCDRVAFADPVQAVGMTAGNFRSAGQIYDWRRFVAELDGPADIAVPQGEPLQLNWDGLRASVRRTTALPERVSLEARQLKVDLAAGGQLASVEDLQAHMRSNGPDIDLAASVEGLLVDKSLADGRTLPPVDGQSDLSITNGVAWAQAGAKSLRGQSGIVRTLALSSGPDTGLSLSGPFSVAEDGKIDADFKVLVRDPRGLAVMLGDVFPEMRSEISGSLSGLALLGNTPTLPLRIVKGRATLGFIPLGDLPPL